MSKKQEKEKEQEKDETLDEKFEKLLDEGYFQPEAMIGWLV
jgi:hypothetical protein